MVASDLFWLGNNGTYASYRARQASHDLLLAYDLSVREDRMGD